MDETSNAYGHKRLLVWKQSMELVVATYAATRAFPAVERHGLASQMQRAAVSIPSNIAEGSARGSKRDSLRFYVFARGSIAELDTQFEIARRLGYLDEVRFRELTLRLDRISRLLNGLRNAHSAGS
ncbi:four helix bundle protein [Thioalbus denitrificans]|uniref:four helix bundle protein n=1 Tax=Thioalbus denitrificans TaxID=547122 RepID=UPI000DF383E8|nr:four helix bundle protein [Thioalbus denitrificans]